MRIDTYLYFEDLFIWNLNMSSILSIVSVCFIANTYFFIEVLYVFAISAAIVEMIDLFPETYKFTDFTLQQSIKDRTSSSQ